MNLTKKQVQFLEYIENFINQYGYSPTYREIASGLGYKSVATVAKHIDNLIILGKLEKSLYTNSSTKIFYLNVEGVS